MSVQTRAGPGRPRLHPADRRRLPRGHAERPARSPRDRLLLSGRDDAGLHQAGLRLQRLARVPAGAGFEVLGISPDKPEKLATFRERDALNFALLSDPDQVGDEGLGAFGRSSSTARSWRGHPLDVRLRRRGRVVELAQYNVKATGHVAKLRRDLGLDSTSGRTSLRVARQPPHLTSGRAAAHRQVGQQVCSSCSASSSLAGAHRSPSARRARQEAEHPGDERGDLPQRPTPACEIASLSATDSSAVVTSWPAAQNSTS